MKVRMLLCLALLTTKISATDKTTTRITETDEICWDSSLCLPPADDIDNIGLAGVFCGYAGENLIIAGGANFPDGTPAEGGKKVWHKDIYVHDGNEWTVYEDALPFPLAYGFSVETENGLLCIGGNNSENCSDCVFLIKLSENGTPQIEQLPPMPYPLSHMAGGRIGNKVLLVGGLTSMQQQKATQTFLCLDLSSGQWSEPKAFEGTPRAFAVAATQSDGIDNCLYVFSGRNFEGNGPWDVLADCWKYNPRLDSWHSVEGEFPVMAGCAVPYGTNHILLLGGRCENGGEDNVVRLFHTLTGTIIEKQVEGATIPVTAPAVKKGTDFIIASGEISPGVRTPIILKGSIKNNIKRMGIWDIIVIILYFASLSWIGIHFSKRQKSADDYMKGGGRIPWFVVGLSIFGTSLSAITFMSIPAKAYATDWSYMFFNAGIILVVPIIVLLFIPFFRRLNVTTAYEYLEQRFNPFVRVICSLAFIIFQVGRMGVVLLLPSIALNIVTGFDIFLCIALMGTLSLVYTYMGGVEAVAWTDALQVVVLLGAALTILFTIAFSLPGGAGEIVSIAMADGKMNLGSMDFDLRQPTFWTVIIATIFTNITTYGTDQTIVQRYLTTDSEKKARKGVYTNALLTIPATLIFFTVGTAIYAWFKTMPCELSASVNDADAILPWYVCTHMPVGVVGLIIAGIFAAAMSTLSASMNSAATAFVTDIQPKIVKDFNVLKAAKRATIVMGAIGIIFAILMATWDIKSLWDEFSKILGILLGGLGGLFLLGFLSKKANSTGAICGIIASMIAQFIVIRTQAVNLLLYSSVGFITCFVIGYIVSIITGGPRKDINHLTIGTLKKEE